MDGDRIDETVDKLFDPPADDGVDDGEAGNGGEHAPPRPVDRFRHTAAGTVIAAGLLGLRDALEGRPERDEIAIVSEAPTRPVDDRITLVFDENDPAATKVIVRRPPDPGDAR